MTWLHTDRPLLLQKEDLHCLICLFENVFLNILVKKEKFLIKLFSPASQNLHITNQNFCILIIVANYLTWQNLSKNEIKKFIIT